MYYMAGGGSSQAEFWNFDVSMYDLKEVHKLSGFIIRLAGYFPLLRTSPFQLCSNSLVDLRLISKAMYLGEFSILREMSCEANWDEIFMNEIGNKKAAIQIMCCTIFPFLVCLPNVVRYANKTEEWMCTLGTKTGGIS